MAASLRIAFALDLATAAAVRPLAAGVFRFAHSRMDWTVLRENDTAVMSWKQAIALEPDGIIGILEPGTLPSVGSKTKVVIVNAAVDEHPWNRVCVDDLESGHRAATHLLDRRLTHFGFVTHLPRHFSELRKKGFTATIRAHRITEPVSTIDVAEVRAQSDAFRVWLSALPKPCGIGCANDAVGAQVINAIEAAGLNVPNDIAVIGVSNDEMGCVEPRVTLTSVREDFEAVGFAAGNRLDELLRNKPIDDPELLLPASDVVERESTRVFAVNDPIVRRALVIIHHNLARPVTVDWLVDQLADVSRRVLELRFRSVLGKSPYEEILNARIAKAKQLLRYTRIPIAEVALEAGFYDTPQLCRHFKSVTNTTPFAYRRVSSDPPSLTLARPKATSSQKRSSRGGGDEA